MKKQIIVLDDRIGINQVMVPINKLIELSFCRNPKAVWDAELERVIGEIRRPTTAAV